MELMESFRQYSNVILERLMRSIMGRTKLSKFRCKLSNDKIFIKHGFVVDNIMYLNCLLKCIYGMW